MVRSRGGEMEPTVGRLRGRNAGSQEDHFFRNLYYPIFMGKKSRAAASALVKQRAITASLRYNLSQTYFIFWKHITYTMYNQNHVLQWKSFIIIVKFEVLQSTIPVVLWYGFETKSDD